MKTDLNKVWRTSFVLLFLAGICVLAAGWGDPPVTTQLSLQLRRGEVEAAPPEQVPVTEEFARLDRIFGGFGIGSGYFDSPVDVAIDAQENLFVLDKGNVRVQSFDSRTDFVMQFGTRGTRKGQFEQPQAIAVDNSGFILVVDTDNHRIQKFDSKGTFVLEWGSLGFTPGSFKYPRDVAFDKENNIYVADTGNERIQVFGPNESRPLAVWEKRTQRTTNDSSFTSVVSLAFDDNRFGYMVALSDTQKLVQRFELDGTFSDKFDIVPAGECVPVRMEIDNEFDYIFIADQAGNRILRYTKGGAYQGELTNPQDPFKRPSGFCIDKNNKRLYVADTGNNRVQKFYYTKY